MVVASTTKIITVAETTATAEVSETKTTAVTRTTREIKTAEASDKVVVFKTIKEAQTRTTEVSEMKAAVTATAVTVQNLRAVVDSEVDQADQRVQGAQAVQKEIPVVLDKTIINKETNS